MRSELIEHYDRLAPKYAELYEGTSRLSHFYKIRRRRVVELMEGIDCKRMLEVGCGAGMMAEQFVDEDFEYHGVDISPGMVRVCKKRYSDNPTMHFSVESSLELESADGEFDLVLSLGMLEYVEDEQRAIQEMVRVLKVGGTLVVSGITKWSPYNSWNRVIYRRLNRSSPVAIIKEFHHEREFRKMLEREGLVVSDVVYFDFNLWLSPLDKWLERFARATTNPMERFCRSPLRKLGNGFLLKCVKSS